MPTLLKVTTLSIYILLSFSNMVSSEATNDFNCDHMRLLNSSKSYQSNAKKLLDLFKLHASQKGYYFASVGNHSDRVYGYYMCRGDFSTEMCDHCISKAVTSAKAEQVNCEYAEGYSTDDQCIFRYADHSMYGFIDDEATIVYGIRYRGGYVSNYQEYSETLTVLMENLIHEAAFGNGSSSSSKLLGFAMKEANVTGNEKIYGLAQCTPDILGSNCSKCLNYLFQDMQKLNDGISGLSGFKPNCLLRYDNTTFFYMEDVDSNSHLPPKINPIYVASSQVRLRPKIIMVLYFILIFFFRIVIV